MDDDGFAVQGRRRKGATREPTRDRGRDSFLREVPKYAGTEEDFDGAHARRYGREEGLGPDGKHHHGSAHFPHGSERQRLHTQYDNSTKPRDKARNAYRNGVLAAENENRSLSPEEKAYYRRNTGGLLPHQHERLDPRATEHRDTSFRNAENRRAMLESHPHGYHSVEEQNRHHGYARNAYQEYETARDNQSHHEKYRSYSKVDERRDKWGRPVSHH